MTRKQQKFTEEFKQGAAKMVLQEGLSQTEVARRLGTSSKNISRWVKELQNIHSTMTPSGDNISTHEKKCAALEKENRRLKMEREILKKAAAFFANESN